MIRRLGILVLACALPPMIGACDPQDRSTSKGQFMPPCPPGGCQSPPLPGGITIENRSGARVLLHVRDADTLRIDRRVIDGTLALPIPEGTLRHERSITLEAGEEVELGTKVTVLDRDSTPPAERSMDGLVIRAGDRPALLALGRGKYFVRADADGSPFVEAALPKLTTLTPTDAPLAECATGTFPAAPFDDAPPELSEPTYIEHGPIRVRHVTLDDSGCRAIEIGDDRDVTLATIRACIPDEAYPFTGSNPVFVTGSVYSGASSTIYFRNADGDVLKLSRWALRARAGFDDGLELTTDERPDCGRIDERCGHVDVPLKITARTSDGAVHSVVYAQPIVHPTRDRTFYVLGGSARPIAHATCSGDHDGAAPTAQATLWMATVSRGEPFASPEVGSP